MVSLPLLTAGLWGVWRLAKSEEAAGRRLWLFAATAMLACRFQPSMVWKTTAIAYRLMPEARTVIAAKLRAFRARVFSSKRSFRYSGTLRAFEP